MVTFVVSGNGEMLRWSRWCSLVSDVIVVPGQIIYSFIHWYHTSYPACMVSGLTIISPPHLQCKVASDAVLER